MKTVVRTLVDRVRGPRDDRLSQQVVRYVIVGGAGYAFAVAFYAGELAAGVPPYPAVAIVFVANGLFNFALMRLWAFPATGRPVASEGLRFAAVAAVSLVVNYSTFALVYSVIGLPAVLAQAVAITVAVPVGFTLNRNWAFAERRSSP